MRIAKKDVPVRVNVPGVVIRQQTDFGDATGYGTFDVEYLSLSAGVDNAPLLRGLENDLCQSPHWGYLLEGELTVTYADGTEEVVHEQELFYWPPGHSIRVSKNAEMVLFSPQHEHSAVIDHIISQMQ